MTPTWPTPEDIAAKRQRGETLTAWETSVYRLNYRDDGTRYSVEPSVRQAQYDVDTSAAADRFQQAAQRYREAHGERATASLENGKIVFIYPDGTKTSGGHLVS